MDELEIELRTEVGQFKCNQQVVYGLEGVLVL